MSKSKYLVTIIVFAIIIFISTWINNTTKVETGTIIKNQIRVIGEIAISDSTTLYWFAIPVDIDGDGYANVFVLDHAQDKVFLKGMPSKVTFQVVNRLHVHKLMPYLYLPEKVALAIPINYN